MIAPCGEAVWLRLEESGISLSTRVGSLGLGDETTIKGDLQVEKISGKGHSVSSEGIQLFAQVLLELDSISRVIS